MESTAGSQPRKNTIPARARRREGPDNKHVVCDDQVATGSLNFSKSATRNPDNSLILHDAALAVQYAQYVDKLVTAYSK